MQHKQRAILGSGFLASIVGLTLIFTLTTPDRLPLVVLLVVFFMMYIAFAIALFVGLKIVCALGGFSWSDHYLRRLAQTVSVVPVFLILLQSIGQLTPQDVLLTLGVGLLAYFYYRRVFTGSKSTS